MFHRDRKGLNSLSTPITASPPSRERSPSGRRRAAPAASEIVSQVRAALWIGGLLIAAVFIAVFLLAYAGSPGATAVAQVLSAVGGVVAVAQAAIAARLLGDVPSSTPAAVPAQEPLSPRFEEPPSQVSHHEQLSRQVARRLILLAAKGIYQVQDLENKVEHPELLKLAFALDHLITRSRRLAENLAVIGGSPLPHRAIQPEVLSQVLFAAMAETQRYAQIDLVNPPETYVHGHAVAEIIHLLAELMENAAMFTNPTSHRVTVKAELVTAGIAIDIQDRGVGIPPERLAQLNALLEGDPDATISDVAEGRIGLTVAQILAFRHGVKVRLQSNIHGGIDAMVVLPSTLLVNAEKPRPHPTPRPFPGRRAELSGAQAAPQLDAAEQGSVAAAGSSPGRHAVYAAATETGAGGTGGYPVVTPASGQALPRRRPATTSFAPESQAITGDLNELAAPPSEQPPALPKRKGSYLHPELLAPPGPAATPTGHDPHLLTDLTQARRRSDADPAELAEPVSDISQNPLTEEGQPS